MSKLTRAPSLLSALPGYPFLPCPICKDEGYQSAVGSCDHTLFERARRTHHGLATEQAADGAALSARQPQDGAK